MNPESNPRIAAIILAAGRSTRMGEAKQLLPLGGQTVLSRTLANVRSAQVHEIVLVLGASADAIRRQVPAEDLNVVINPDYEQGMASSLCAGLSALGPRTDAAFIVLADQPFVLPQTFASLADHHRRTKAPIVIPAYRGVRGNPVLLDRSVFPEIMALQGDVGCRAIFDHHLQEILKVEVEDEGILLDIDNRDDYERLKK